MGSGGEKGSRFFIDSIKFSFVKSVSSRLGLEMLLNIKLVGSVFGFDNTDLYCLLRISAVFWGPLSNVLHCFNGPIFSLDFLFLSAYLKGLWC